MTKFTETQAFPTIAYGALGFSAVATVWAILAGPARTFGSGMLWPVLPLCLAFNLLCERTVVTEMELSVSFGALFPLYTRRVALADIISAEAVTYSPLAEYGGWGIRGWGKSVALNAHGNRGVRLALRDGRRLLVGSQRPEALAEALTPPR